MKVALLGVAEDIRDIRGPKIEPENWIATGIIAAAILIAVCAYIVKRQRRGATIRPLSLLEKTLERLEETKPLMQPATAREFASAASEVIRTYIEKRFSVVATQRTTEEFLLALLQGADETLARHRPLLAEFLQKCDYVKFAGASLEVSDMESLLHSARAFVLETSAT